MQYWVSRDTFCGEVVTVFFVTRRQRVGSLTQLSTWSFVKRFHRKNRKKVCQRHFYFDHRLLFKRNYRRMMPRTQEGWEDESTTTWRKTSDYVSASDSRSRSTGPLRRESRIDIERGVRAYVQEERRTRQTSLTNSKVRLLFSFHDLEGYIHINHQRIFEIWISFWRNLISMARSLICKFSK